MRLIKILIVAGVMSSGQIALASELNFSRIDIDPIATQKFTEQFMRPTKSLSAPDFRDQFDVDDANELRFRYPSHLDQISASEFQQILQLVARDGDGHPSLTNFVMHLDPNEPSTRRLLEQIGPVGDAESNLFVAALTAISTGVSKHGRAILVDLMKRIAYRKNVTLSVADIQSLRLLVNQLHTDGAQSSAESFRRDVLRKYQLPAEFENQLSEVEFIARQFNDTKYLWQEVSSLRNSVSAFSNQGFDGELLWRKYESLAERISLLPLVQRMKDALIQDIIAEKESTATLILKAKVVLMFSKGDLNRLKRLKLAVLSLDNVTYEARELARLSETPEFTGLGDFSKRQCIQLFD